MGDYDFWRASLRGEKPKIQAEIAHCGFYKRRLHKDSPWFPVAIWRDKQSGTLVGAFQGKLVDPAEQWSWIADKPVTEEAYRFHIANGHWPDEPAPAATAPSANGSNMPSDPFEALKLEVESKLEQARDLVREEKATKGTISEVVANKARNIQAGLLALNKRADAMHKAEKQPHLDASRAVDAKFDFRKPVQTAADALRLIFEAYMKAEEARQRVEAQKKFEEERKKAEEARKAAEAERKALEEQDPFLAHITEQEPLPELPLAPEPVKINVGGGTGRRAGLKTVHVGRITDWDKVLKHFSEHQQVRDLLQKLVDADVRTNKAQCKIPGVQVLEERKAA